MTLREIVNEESATGRWFNHGIQALIVVSIISFSLQTLPNLDSSTRRALHAVEFFTVVCFTIEYAMRIVAAERRVAFILSPYGIIDFLAIAPFYATSGVDLRSLRILRLFQAFRALKLLRYSKAIHRFGAAFRDIREELILFLVATGFFVFMAAVGIYQFEHEAQPDQFRSIFHCMWWAIATLTTVGYGDMYPITTGGRIFTGLITLIGVGVIAVPSGLMASALTKARREEG